MSDDEWIRNLRPPHIKRMLALHKREVAALEAENARLREALRATNNMRQSSVPDHFEFRSKARLIARAALSQDKEQET